MKKCEERERKKLTRKQALKRAKEEEALRKEFRLKVENFLINWCMDRIRDHDEYLQRVLWYGFRGYEKMSNKDLMKEFERVYAELRDPEEPCQFYSTSNGEYRRRNNIYGTQRVSLTSDDQLVLRNLYIELSEILMLELFEALVLR